MVFVNTYDAYNMHRSLSFHPASHVFTVPCQLCVEDLVLLSTELRCFKANLDICHLMAGIRSCAGELALRFDWFYPDE